MNGSIVIGIRLDTIGTGIEAIGLGHRMPALAGTLLVMKKGCISKATGQEIAAGFTMTTTGTVIEAGIIGRKSAIARESGIKTMIASSSGSNNQRTVRVYN
jgi:hypothetical protein